jgi:hypothetical protein
MGRVVHPLGYHASSYQPLFLLVKFSQKGFLDFSIIKSEKK